MYFVTFCNLQQKVLQHWNIQTYFPLISVCCLVKTLTCQGAHNTSCSHLLNTSPHKPTQVNWAFALQFILFIYFLIKIYPLVYQGQSGLPGRAKLPHSVLCISMKIPIKRQANTFVRALTGQVLTSASNSPREKAQGNVSNIYQFFRPEVTDNGFLLSKSPPHTEDVKQDKTKQY